MKVIQLTKGFVTEVDDSDYDDLIKYRWCMNGKYAFNAKLGNMHRYLLGFIPNKGKRGPGDNQVDHINNNPLDNTRSNLRFATFSENQLNHSSTGGRSEYRGVIWAGKQKGLIHKPWIARLKPTGCSRMYLGSFKTEEEAAIAYNTAVLKHCNTFGTLNKISLRD